MFSFCNPKFFAVRHIHYPANPSSDHFHTDVVVPSSDHCRTEIVLPPHPDHCSIDTVTPSSDHYCIDLVVPSSDHCCSDTVLPSSDHYGTTKSTDMQQNLEDTSSDFSKTKPKPKVVVLGSSPCQNFKLVLQPASQRTMEQRNISCGVRAYCERYQTEIRPARASAFETTPRVEIVLLPLAAMCQHCRSTTRSISPCSGAVGQVLCLTERTDALEASSRSKCLLVSTPACTIKPGAYSHDDVS